MFVAAGLSDDPMDLTLMRARPVREKKVTLFCGLAWIDLTVFANATCWIPTDTAGCQVLLRAVESNLGPHQRAQDRFLHL